MKRTLITAICVALAIVACNKNNPVATPANPRSQTIKHPGKRFSLDSTDTMGSKFISVNDANKMINSYLYSINYQTNDTDLRSFSIDADSLRAYLAISTVKKVKLIFAHTLDYITTGNMGNYAGYQSGALTLIIVGYDTSGNYVYYTDGKVLDHVIPCPYTCPSGTAGSELLQ